MTINLCYWSAFRKFEIARNQSGIVSNSPIRGAEELMSVFLYHVSQDKADYLDTDRRIPLLHFNGTSDLRLRHIAPQELHLKAKNLFTEVV